MSDFIFKSASELAMLIRAGKATSTEIVQAHLDHIRKHNRQLNAVVQFFEKEALEIASECDKEAEQGKFRGSLHGIPMTIKEQFSIKGTPSTLNSNRLKNWIATDDSVVVERLKEAGAIIIGKTNVAKELFDYQVYGDVYPVGKNPYNLGYSPGGSSGGASASLASGMTPLEVGADFGGSIRIPANFCGVYGLKTTEDTIPRKGIVPRKKGEKAFVFNMAVAGPMARTPEDVELLWKVLVGSHKSDRNTPKINWENIPDKRPEEYRLAWTDRWEGYEPSSETQEVIKDFVELVTSKGYKAERAIPDKDLHDRSLSLYKRLSLQLIMQEMPWYVKPLFVKHIKKSVFNGNKTKLKWKFRESMLDYSEVMGKRADIINEWETFFEDYDFLICPSGFGTAYECSKPGEPINYRGEKIAYMDYVWPYNACFNSSGNPSLNIPLGIGRNGLPVGVQIVGPYWSEPELIKFAKHISQYTTGFVKPGWY
jgi:amidase